MTGTNFQINEYVYCVWSTGINLPLLLPWSISHLRDSLGKCPTMNPFQNVTWGLRKWGVLRVGVRGTECIAQKHTNRLSWSMPVFVFHWSFVLAHCINISFHYFLIHFSTFPFNSFYTFLLSHNFQQLILPSIKTFFTSKYSLPSVKFSYLRSTISAKCYPQCNNDYTSKNKDSKTHWN